MISFKQLKRRCMAYYILFRRMLEMTDEELKFYDLTQQETRDGKLMNSLYWPKGNNGSSNAPPRYEPNSATLRRLGYGNKTTRTH